MNADLWDLEDVGAGARQVRARCAVACGPAYAAGPCANSPPARRVPLTAAPAPRVPRCAQELLRSDAAAEPEQYNEKCGVIGIFNVEQVPAPRRCSRAQAEDASRARARARRVGLCALRPRCTPAAIPPARQRRRMPLTRCGAGVCAAAVWRRVGWERRRPTQPTTGLSGCSTAARRARGW